MQKLLIMTASIRHHCDQKGNDGPHVILKRLFYDGHIVFVYTIAKIKLFPLFSKKKPKKSKI